MAESQQQKHSIKVRDIHMTSSIYKSQRIQQRNWLCNSNCWGGIRDGIRTMLRIGLIMTIHTHSQSGVYVISVPHPAHQSRRNRSVDSCSIGINSPLQGYSEMRSLCSKISLASGAISGKGACVVRAAPYPSVSLSRFLQRLKQGGRSCTGPKCAVRAPVIIQEFASPSSIGGHLVRNP